MNRWTKVTESGGKEITMVDREKLNEQLRKLKKLIREDPETKKIYDLDGDGQISSEEWEKARQGVIAFMEATDSGGSAQDNASADMAGESTGAASHVFSEIKDGRLGIEYGQTTTLFTEPVIEVRQVVESLELMTDFEGRNKYKFFTPKGKPLAHAEEIDYGFAGAVLRNLLSLGRPFDMGISVMYTSEIIWLKRRFEFILSRIDVSDEDTVIGTVKQRFSLFKRKYDLNSHLTPRKLKITGSIFKPWTFNITADFRQVGSIKKKYSGFLKEAFTRADTFEIAFDERRLTRIERKLIFAAAIAIDIDYFERSQK